MGKRIGYIAFSLITANFTLMLCAPTVFIIGFYDFVFKVMLTNVFSMLFAFETGIGASVPMLIFIIAPSFRVAMTQLWSNIATFTVTADRASVNGITI